MCKIHKSFLRGRIDRVWFQKLVVLKVSVFFMIPIGQRNGVIVVVIVNLSIGVVNDERSAKSVGVLSLIMSMKPISSSLTFCFSCSRRVQYFIVE